MHPWDGYVASVDDGLDAGFYAGGGAVSLGVAEVFAELFADLFFGFACFEFAGYVVGGVFFGAEVEGVWVEGAEGGCWGELVELFLCALDVDLAWDFSVFVGEVVVWPEDEVFPGKWAPVGVVGSVDAAEGGGGGDADVVEGVDAFFAFDEYDGVGFAESCAVVEWAWFAFGEAELVAAFYGVALPEFFSAFEFFDA